MQKLTSAAAQAGAELAEVAALKTESLPAGMMAAISVGMGVMRTIAQLYAKRELSNPTQDEYTLAVLTLLAYADFSPEGMEVEHGIERHVALFDLFEKHTGRKPDSFVNPTLVQAVRMVEAGAADNLVNFMAERSKRKDH